MIGRKLEVERTIEILCRRRKNNPLYVGEAGVGKTAIAEGLARLITEGKVPDVLTDCTIYSLDMGTLIAGTPDQVRAEIERQVEILGVNYLITYPYFGNMQLGEAMNSLRLFSTEVMPKIAHL